MRPCRLAAVIGVVVVVSVGAGSRSLIPAMPKRSQLHRDLLKLRTAAIVGLIVAVVVALSVRLIPNANTPPPAKIVPDTSSWNTAAAIGLFVGVIFGWGFHILYPEGDEDSDD